MEIIKIQFRWMEPDEVSKIKDIDRSQQIRSGYQYVDGELLQIEVNWDSPPWATKGDGAYTVAAQMRFCLGHLGRNGYYRTCQTNNVNNVLLIFCAKMN